jgi:hypothetical protein
MTKFDLESQNKSNKPPLKNGSSDDFQTPKIALTPLIPFLKKDWEIWECAEGKGNLTQGLKEQGFSVYGSDLKDNSACDFLTWQPFQKFDCIVTNPPFSLKQEFLQRCYELKKPFALLLPLTTFETAKRQELFKKYGLQVIFFDKRINFETPSGKGGGSWFATAWFTHGLHLPKELNFVKLENPKQTKL